ncbi:Planctomycete cytochrome C [Stieleria neptunia]|uniref:Planctomycete cytochrome C n=1 Tax=Stieleria neptunia TaxID=2527979 RepID=A0A518HX62_9BACT|nr:PSD1 and planctomycete cytochrome C domain-containing protein [Stieleria neptunia]QDV45442.1 Planctomycete cytochrome C [Stieleria neptunia]
MNPIRLSVVAPTVLLVGLGCFILTAETIRAADSQSSAKLDFAADIRPILSDACYHCHGPDANAREGGFRLDDRREALDSGVLSSGDMLKRLTSDDPDVRMPPPDSNRRLRRGDRAKLKRWLAEGADWPEDDRHWAFIPPVRPDLPAVNDTHWPRNPIDRFVLARLETEGFKPSPPADRATLLRRVSFDLTGLPPTIEELDAFLNDETGGAYERAVDRLLESPRYGEHMAVDWLEASRFADTDGYQNDRLRYMSVWRDWLINALNDNMPFDRFVIEQMAGDLLPDRNFLTQVATGFNRNHRINSEGGSIPDEWIVEYVADRVETTGTVFLGLTMTCSRCHDHKYDPISQKDFYSLFAFFNNIDEAGLGPNNGNSPPFIKVPKSWPDLADDELKFVVPEPVKIKVVQTSVPRPQPGGEDTVMVLHELDKPRDTYRLDRGQYDNPDTSEKLKPATPPVLGAWNDDWPRNRLGLARWLVDPDHPLTARVTINRLWQHHFGVGLVKTSENFGVQGELPSHPKLLDWLATEFIRTGWDVKAMHRLVVTSATYRQQSSASETLRERDPENRWLARAPRKRLSPFAIRDSMLFASSLLNDSIGGPSVKPYMPPAIWSSISNAKYKQDTGEKLYRRSMYTYWRRTVPPPTMMAFNAAARETCIVRSDETTTPLQALTMMNNITFVEAARHLAERVMKPDGLAPSQRIALAFRLVTSRQPRADELAVLVDDFHVYHDDFQQNADATERLLSVGETPNTPGLDRRELAALTLVANTILNLDEAIAEN